MHQKREKKKTCDHFTKWKHKEDNQMAREQQRFVNLIFNRGAKSGRATITSRRCCCNTFTHLSQTSLGPEGSSVYLIKAASPRTIARETTKTTEIVIVALDRYSISPNEIRIRTWRCDRARAKSRESE